jgi:hypothetical protein
MNPAVERYVEAASVVTTRQGRATGSTQGFTGATIADNLLGCDPGRALCVANGVSRMARNRPPCSRVRFRREHDHVKPVLALTWGRKYDNPSAALAPPRLTYPSRSASNRRSLCAKASPTLHRHASRLSGRRCSAPKHQTCCRHPHVNHATNHGLAVGDVRPDPPDVTSPTPSPSSPTTASTPPA